MADINKRLNLDFTGGSPNVPYNTGDRYYSQDLIRDMQYLRSLSALTIAKLFSSFPVFLSGGLVTQGVGSSLNITPAYGVVKYSVSIPNTCASIPPTVMAADIYTKVETTAQTNMAVAPGAGKNYVKINYSETAGNTRTRSLAGGVYNYEYSDSFAFVVDNVAPTNYDLVIATLVNNAGTFAITQYLPTPLYNQTLPVTTIYTQDYIDIPITKSGFVEVIIESNQKMFENYSAFSTWATTGAMNTARQELAGAGVQGSAVCFGGYIAAVSLVTELFNGLTWAGGAGFNMNTAREYLGGTGIKNAALSFGGFVAACSLVTEIFNGATWSTAAGFNLNTARQALAGAGILNASLSFLGNTGAARLVGAVSVVTEKFNGATWSTNAAWNAVTGRYSSGGAGVQGCALSFAGDTNAAGGTNSVVTEKFNGSAWSTNAAWNILNTRRSCGGKGTQNVGIVVGGFEGAVSAKVEKFTGNAWSNTGNLNTARQYVASVGIMSQHLAFGGSTGAVSAVTEKFYQANRMKMWIALRDDHSDYTTNVIYVQAETYESTICLQIQGPARLNVRYINDIIFDTEANKLTAYTTGLQYFNYGYFAAGGNMNTARENLVGTGVSSAALSIGGNPSAVEGYNGSIWTALSGLVYDRQYMAGRGLFNSSIVAGGDTATAKVAYVEKWNGSSWIASTNMNTARRQLGMAGHQNACVAFGGYYGADLATTEDYNGTVWSTVSSINTARDSHAGCGRHHAALLAGGTAGGAIATTETWNGQAWSLSGSLNTARYGLAMNGRLNYAMSCAGTTGTVTNVCEKFNGLTWGVRGGQTLTARQYPGASGNVESHLIFGGNTGAAVSAVTELFLYNRDVSELYATEDCWTGKVETIITY